MGAMRGIVRTPNPQCGAGRVNKDGLLRRTEFKGAGVRPSLIAPAEIERTLQSNLAFVVERLEACPAAARNGLSTGPNELAAT